MTATVRATREPSDEAEAIHDAAERLVAVWTRAHDSAEGRVSASQLRTLLAIARCEPIIVSALASELGAMVSSVTRLCDRLVAAGYVDRGTSPSSRRQVVITLTNAGRRLLDEIRAQRLSELAAILSRMPAADRQALLVGLTAFQNADSEPRSRRRP
jgi:DNA-binding MarR family transcriptional regulator